MRKLAIFGLLALCPLFAGPQTLLLRDGRTISGTFVSGSADSIVFRDDNGARRTYSTNEIQSIDFSSGSSNVFGNRGRYGANRGYEGTNGANRGYEGTNRSDANRGYANRGYSGAAVAGSRELPAGTEIVVRTNEDIRSESANSGQSYAAVIDRDVMDAAGAVVIPRGSNAQLIVRDVSGGGTTGSANLALDLQTVSANGRTYMVSTQDIEQSNQSGIGKNKRTAEMVGGGAVLGTLLGAIAGGGKGAAIGAAAGAAAGGAAQVLTRGKTVNVPAETQLTFRLDQPLQLIPR